MKGHGWALCFFCACTAERERVAVQLPTNDSASSFVLRVQDRGLYAGTISEPLRIEDIDSSALELAFYDVSLEELALTSGHLTARLPCRSCTLFQPKEVYRAESPGAPWEIIPFSSAFASDLVPDGESRCRCIEVETQVIDVPSPDNFVTGALTESNGSALVVYDHGAIVRIGEDMSSEALCSSPLEIINAAVAGSSLWVTNGERVLELSLVTPRGRTCEVLRTLPKPGNSRVRDMDAVGDELIALNLDGSLWQLREGVWEELGSIPPVDVDNSDGEARIVAPGVFVAARDSAEVLWVEDGQARRETVREGAGMEVLTLRDRSVIAATSVGIGVREGGVWQWFEVPEWTGAASLTPLLNGMLVSLDSGAFTQITGDWKLCPARTGFSSERVYHAASMSPKTALFADTFDIAHPRHAVGVVQAVDRCSASAK